MSMALAEGPSRSDVLRRMEGMEAQYRDAIVEAAMAVIYPPPTPNDPLSMLRSVWCEMKVRTASFLAR